MLYLKVCICMGCLLFHICYQFVLYYYIFSHYRCCDNLGEYIKVCWNQELLFHPACNLLIFILPLVDISQFINLVYSQSFVFIKFFLRLFVFTLALIVFTQVFLVSTGVDLCLLVSTGVLLAFIQGQLVFICVLFMFYFVCLFVFCLCSLVLGGFHPYSACVHWYSFVFTLVLLMFISVLNCLL